MTEQMKLRSKFLAKKSQSELKKNNMDIRKVLYFMYSKVDQTGAEKKALLVLLYLIG